jgi:hypothetical protein
MPPFVALIVNPTNTSPLNGEFWDTAFAMEDVYGFGVVLLQLITGVDSSRMTGSSNSLLNEWNSLLKFCIQLRPNCPKSLEYFLLLWTTYCVFN